MRMFWKRHEPETFEGWPAVPRPLASLSETLVVRPLAQVIEVERDVPRVVSISRNAKELRWRGEEVVELFKEVDSPVGRAVLPIHRKHGGENVFVEIETGPWKKKMVRDMLKTAAMFRNLEYADAVLGLGSLPRSGGGPPFLQTSPCGLGSVEPYPIRGSGEGRGSCRGVQDRRRKALGFEPQLRPREATVSRGSATRNPRSRRRER